MRRLGGGVIEAAMMAAMGYGQFSFSGSVAEGYRASLEPLIFEPWADELVRFAGVAPGEAVLDVAAGTGTVSRAAARATGGEGRVVASDISEDMLAQVIRDDEPAPIETVVCSATELDLASGTFDVVLCQQGLQFVPDRPAAAAEMRRVLRPGGRVAAAVWLAGVPLHPFGLYGEVLEAAGLEETMEIRRLMMSPDELGALLAGGGFGDIALETRELSFRWASSAAGARGVAGTPFQAFLATLSSARLTEVMGELERAIDVATDAEGGFTMTAVLGRATA
jgi:SAM-dependent methyltransferase